MSVTIPVRRLSGQRDQLYLEIGGTKLPLAKEWKYKVAVDSRKYGYVEFGPNAYPSLLYNGMIAPLDWASY